MELKKISREDSRTGVKVSLLARFEDISSISDEEFDNVLEVTKRNLGSTLVCYVSGRHKDGVVLEFLNCQTPANW